MANLPALMPLILTSEDLAVAAGFEQPKPGSTAEILAHFERTVGDGRPLLESADADQLAIHLRLCGAPVPGRYGPSADEKT